MNITDSIADMLTRIRNAGAAKKEEVVVPHSQLKAEIDRIGLTTKFGNTALLDGTFGTSYALTGASTDFSGEIAVLLVDALPESIAREFCYLDRRAHLFLGLLDHLCDRCLAVAAGAQEGLLHQHHLLVEFLA